MDAITITTVFTADNRVEASRKMQQKMGAMIVLPRDYRLQLEVLYWAFQ